MCERGQKNSVTSASLGVKYKAQRQIIELDAEGIKKKRSQKKEGERRTYASECVKRYLSSACPFLRLTRRHCVYSQALLASKIKYMRKRTLMAKVRKRIRGKVKMKVHLNKPSSSYGKLVPIMRRTLRPQSMTSIQLSFSFFTSRRRASSVNMRPTYRKHEG